MSWQQKTIGIKVPAAASAISSAVGNISASLSPVIEVARSFLDAAKVFYSSGSNPFSALVSVVIPQIESALNDLFGSGFYQLTVTPIYRGGFACDDMGIPTLTPGEALAQARESFEDEGDLVRPQFSSSVQVSGFGFLLTAASLDGLRTLINNFVSVFDVAELRELDSRFKERLAADTVASQHPDWKALSLKSIHPLGGLHAGLSNLLAMFRGYMVRETEVMDNAVAVLLGKLERLIELAEQFQSLIKKVTDAVSASGVYFLDIPEKTGGNDYLIEQLSDEGLESLTQNKYSVLLVFVAGGPAVSGIGAIKGLLE